jgi:hypothetical protein
VAAPPSTSDESLFAERLYIEGWALALTFATEEELRGGRISVGILCGPLLKTTRGVEIIHPLEELASFHTTNRMGLGST